jgi:hypothetical protein
MLSAIMLCGCDSQEKAIRKEAAYRMYEICLKDMSDTRLCQCIHDELINLKSLFSADVAKSFLLAHSDDRLMIAVAVSGVKCHCRLNPHIDSFDGLSCKEFKKIRTLRQFKKSIMIGDFFDDKKGQI